MEDASAEKVRFMELGWRTVLSILITKIPLLLTWLCFSASITTMNNSNNHALSFLGTSISVRPRYSIGRVKRSANQCDGPATVSDLTLTSLVRGPALQHEAGAAHS